MLTHTLYTHTHTHTYTATLTCHHVCDPPPVKRWLEAEALRRSSGDSLRALKRCHGAGQVAEAAVRALVLASMALKRAEPPLFTAATATAKEENEEECSGWESAMPPQALLATWEEKVCTPFYCHSIGLVRFILL